MTFGVAGRLLRCCVRCALQLAQLQDTYEKKVPLGPHGSARPNKQTLEDIKKHGKAEMAVKHTDLVDEK